MSRGSASQDSEPSDMGMEWGMYAVDHAAFTRRFGSQDDGSFPELDELEDALDEDLEARLGMELLPPFAEGVTWATVDTLLSTGGQAVDMPMLSRLRDAHRVSRSQKVRREGIRYYEPGEAKVLLAELEALLPLIEDSDEWLHARRDFADRVAEAVRTERGFLAIHW